MTLACFAVSLVLGGLLLKYFVPTLSADGKYYLTRPGLRPYCMRRLMRDVLGTDERRWRWLNWACTVLAATSVGAYCGSPWASAVVLGLPVLRVGAALPVLTDPPALLCLAVSLATGRWEFAALGGLFNEKAPLFGALMLWQPLALVGLVLPSALFAVGTKPLPSDPEWLRTPFKSAFARIARLGDPNQSVWPWGGALLGFPHLDVKGWLAVLAGYAQLLMAQDGPRLYQWAAFAVVKQIPPQFLPLAALGCWVNPRRDDV